MTFAEWCDMKRAKKQLPDVELKGKELAAAQAAYAARNGDVPTVRPEEPKIGL